MKSIMVNEKQRVMLQKGLKVWKSVSVYVFMAFFIPIAGAWAEDLTFFYNASLKFDPQLAGARHEHQASREILRQAYAQMLPSLSAEAAYIHTRDDIESSDNTVYASGATRYPTKTYSVVLVQPVFNYASFIGISKAKEELKQHDARLRNAEQTLIMRVAEAYFDALTARDNHEFTLAEQIAVDSNSELTRERHAMGLTPVQDMLDAKARFAFVSANTIQAESLLKDALVALYEISGVNTESILRLKKDLLFTSPDPEGVEAWIKIAMDHNAVLEERKAAVQTAGKSVRHIKAGHYPVLDIEGRNDWRDTEGSLFGGGSEVDTQELYIRFKLPIYQGGIVNSQSRQAYQIQQWAAEELRRQTLLVERQTRAAFLGVKTALNKTRALEQAVSAQQLTLEAKQEGYKSGLNTIMSVLDAERDLYFAKKDYARARYDYILNILRLKQAVGTLDKGDITMVNAWLAAKDQ